MAETQEDTAYAFQTIQDEPAVPASAGRDVVIEVGAC